MHALFRLPTAVDKFRKQRKKKRQANDKLLPLVEQTIAQAGLTNAVTVSSTGVHVLVWRVAHLQAAVLLRLTTFAPQQFFAAFD